MTREIARSFQHSLRCKVNVRAKLKSDEVHSTRFCNQIDIKTSLISKKLGIYIVLNFKSLVERLVLVILTST